jgi:RNA polymerase sigma-70 factor, ECF subfamily
VDFEAFFHRTAPQLVRLCFLVTLDREAGADAAQETLARAWRDWERIGAEHSDPAAWARTVALNLCRNRWRRLAQQARLVPRAYIAESRTDDLPDVDLQRALGRLPSRQREAVVLHYWSDLSVEACAAAMGVSAGSVKQHLSRARSRLAVELGTTVPELEVEAP